MRARTLAALALAGAMLPAMAAAQHTSGTGSPMSDLMNLNQFITRGIWNQWSATRPAALAGFSPEARQWMKAQVREQALAPRQPEAILADIDVHLGKEIARMAKSRRVPAEDISGAVLMKVMHDTKLALTLEQRRVRKAEGEAAAEAFEARIAQADANRRSAAEFVSSTSLALARD